MPIGALIIGDEIMRGKRQDKHMAQLIAILRSRGLTLAWCEYLGDDPELITATLGRTLAGTDIVFSFGGIGATPDDHTRACAAAAAGVVLVLHPEAEAEIRGRFGADTTPSNVAAIFRAINPLFPMPVTTTRPAQENNNSTAR